jgi:hypothetical protein
MNQGLLEVRQMLSVSILLLISQQASCLWSLTLHTNFASYDSRSITRKFLIIVLCFSLPLCLYIIMSQTQSELRPVFAKVQIAVRNQTELESSSWAEIMDAQESATKLVTRSQWEQVPIGKVTDLGQGLNVLFFQDKDTGAPENRLNVALLFPLMKQLPKGDRDIVLRAYGESAGGLRPASASQADHV